MGFLTFWNEQHNDDVSQNNLLKPADRHDLTQDATEASRKLAHGRLRQEVEKRSGRMRTHAAVSKAADEIMLGERSEDLYRALGLNKGSRDQLPPAAKQALMTGDIAAYHQIMQDDAQGHYPVVQSAKKGYIRARQLFPW
jgi:hypothetical protein